MLGSDELISEIPVFQSKAFHDQLYLMQYPLMPQSISLDKWNIKEVKIKPDQERIRITMDVNTEVRYEKNKETSKLLDSNNVPLERQRIMETSSLPNPSKSSRYIVGIFRGGKLHLSSFKSIVAVRDIVPHPNIREQDCRNLDLDEQEPASTQTEPEPEPTKINVKFSQFREGGSKPKYVRSYSFRRHHHEEDPWVHLNQSHGPNQLAKLYSNSFENETPFYCLSAKDYLGFLFPRVVEVKIGISTGSVQKTPISELKNLPLQDQLRQIMVSTKVIRYSDLMEVVHRRLAGDVDDESLLRSLQCVAILVQGCWVVKSDVLFPATFTSNCNGINADEIQRGRDSILSHLNEKRLVERREMCSLTKLPIDEVTEILSDVAVVIEKKGWEFKYPFDSDFVATYPEVVQRQSLMWELKISNRQRAIDFKVPSGKSSLSSISQSNTQQRKSQSKTVSFSSDTDSGSESGKKKTRKRQYLNKKK